MGAVVISDMVDNSEPPVQPELCLFLAASAPVSTLTLPQRSTIVPAWFLWDHLDPRSQLTLCRTGVAS